VVIIWKARMSFIYVNPGGNMFSSFKKRIGDKEYTFYRTRVSEDIVYFALFENAGSRDSIKISKDTFGQWKLTSFSAKNIDNKEEFIEAVTLKESQCNQTISVKNIVSLKACCYFAYLSFP
jgi:hypothetical protein